MVADGRVAPAELDVVTRLDRAGLGPLSWRVRRELDRATRGPLDIDAACATVRGAGVTLVGAVLTMLARIAAAGRRVGEPEQKLFAAVAERLGVEPEAARRHVEPLWPRRSEAGDDRPERHPVRFAEPEPGPRVFDGAAAALQQLGLGRDASSADVDAAYLRLVDRYDPGRLAPLGADFVTLAVRELASLTEAYERARSAVRA